MYGTVVKNIVKTVTTSKGVAAVGEIGVFQNCFVRNLSDIRFKFVKNVIAILGKVFFDKCISLSFVLD